MGEYQPVSTKIELALLDDGDIIAGYLAGLRGDSEPGSAFSRSYWHGWRNGCVDAGLRQTDDAQQQLAKEVVNRWMQMH